MVPTPSKPSPPPSLTFRRGFSISLRSDCPAGPEPASPFLPLSLSLFFFLYLTLSLYLYLSLILFFPLFLLSFSPSSLSRFSLSPTRTTDVYTHRRLRVYLFVRSIRRPSISFRFSYRSVAPVTVNNCINNLRGARPICRQKLAWHLGALTRTNVAGDRLTGADSSTPLARGAKNKKKKE